MIKDIVAANNNVVVGAKEIEILIYWTLSQEVLKLYAGNVLCADTDGKPASANGRNEKRGVPNVQNYAEQL